MEVIIDVHTEKNWEYKIIQYEEVDSTNDEAKRLIRAATPASADSKPPITDDNSVAVTPALYNLYGSVVVARRQTAGRGRRGREFASPGLDSVYASFILPPPQNLEGQLITAFAAVAVCEAIEQTTSYKPGIKWVNDIFVDGKKVCGILAETIPHAVVLGIGVNINLGKDDIPDELRDIAGSLYMDDATRERFFSVMAALVFRYMETAGCGATGTGGWAQGCEATGASGWAQGCGATGAGLWAEGHGATGAGLWAEGCGATGADGWVQGCGATGADLMGAYRTRSILLGNRINIIKDEVKRSAVAAEIADDGALVVRYDDGSIDTLRSSEFSVRLADQ